MRRRGGDPAARIPSRILGLARAVAPLGRTSHLAAGRRLVPHADRVTSHRAAAAIGARRIAVLAPIAAIHALAAFRAGKIREILSISLGLVARRLVWLSPHFSS